MLSLALLLAAIVVGTWNGDWLPDGGPDHRASDEEAARRIADAGRLLARGLAAVDPEGTNEVILCLNEIRGPKVARKVAAAIGRTNLTLAVVSGYRYRDRFEKQQDVILTTLPVATKNWSSWKHEKGIRPPRGYAHAELVLSSAVTASVYAVHLKANTGRRESETARENRAKRSIAVRQLVAMTKDLDSRGRASPDGSAPTPVIVAGDFNADPARAEFKNETVFADLAAAGFSDLLQLLPPAARATYVHAYFGPSSIDHVFVRGLDSLGAPTILPGNKTSDHAPVFALVRSPVQPTREAAKPRARKPSDTQSETGLLPDGTRFAFWDDETAYRRTWHVDGAAGSDGNPGTEARPFRTINRAAAAAAPGEKVLIHAGVYRETVTACRGGTDARNMVAFEAAGDGPVTISGARPWQVGFQPSEGFRTTVALEEVDLFPYDPDATLTSNRHARVWSGDLPHALFDEPNPFALPNTSLIGWCPFRKSLPSVCRTVQMNKTQYREALMRRGGVFRDGVRMRQVHVPYELWNDAVQTQDVFWVEGDGARIHFRLCGDAAPEGHRFEVTVRRQGFAPALVHTSWVRLSGLRFEKFANPLAPPQEGAVSFACGHHWIVEDCVFEEINTYGMDIGFKSHFTGRKGLRGHDIIRRNAFRACGIGGVCGVPAAGAYMDSVLFENNELSGCGWLMPIYNDESHAFKLHFARNCLIRGNTFRETVQGGAVWLDKCVANNRVTGNRIDGFRDYYGGIFVEGTTATNRVDHNVLRNGRLSVVEGPGKGQREWRGGHGIALQDLDNARVDGNDISGMAGFGVRLYGDDERLIRGARVSHVGTSVTNNLIRACARGAVQNQYPAGNAVLP